MLWEPSSGQEGSLVSSVCSFDSASDCFTRLLQYEQLTSEFKHTGLLKTATLRDIWRSVQEW